MDDFGGAGGTLQLIWLDLRMVAQRLKTMISVEKYGWNRSFVV